MAYTNGSVEDFASIFAAQYEAMKASGALGEDNNLTQQEFLEQFYRQGEFTHDSSNPFLNFVSSVLDITIIKPIIEACTGEDLITGEDLTDMERGLKVVFAMVDLVTLGGAIAATKFSEMGLKEGLKAFGKTALIDFAGNTAACGVGALGETFDWPVPVTMMLSLAAGITVSISGNKLLFKNADGIEIGSKANLLDDTGKFIDDTLENNYQAYIKRKISKGQTPKDRLEWKQASEYWTKESPVARGNNFNKTVREADIYDYHEIFLENGKRLDSYDPDAGEIISRKATDLDKISEETYRRYLSEFSSKYSEGTKIRSNAYPELDGQELRGQYILEIPASNANLSNIDYYEKIASEYDVILRFTEEVQ